MLRGRKARIIAGVRASTSWCRPVPLAGSACAKAKNGNHESALCLLGLQRSNRFRRALRPLKLQQNLAYLDESLYHMQG